MTLRGGSLVLLAMLAPHPSALFAVGADDAFDVYKDEAGVLREVDYTPYQILGKSLAAEYRIITSSIGSRRLEIINLTQDLGVIPESYTAAKLRYYRGPFCIVDLSIDLGGDGISGYNLTSDISVLIYSRLNDDGGGGDVLLLLDCVRPEERFLFQYKKSDQVYLQDLGRGRNSDLLKQVRELGHTVDLAIDSAESLQLKNTKDSESRAVQKPGRP